MGAGRPPLGTAARAAAGARAARLVRLGPDSRARRACSWRLGKGAASGAPLPELPGGLHAALPRVELAAARPAAAALGGAAAAAPRWCSTRTVSAIPAGRGNAPSEVNRPLRRALSAADHVLYQSEFSKRAADEFLGEPERLLGDPAQRGRRRAVHARRGVPARRRARAAARRRPDAGLPARARARDARGAPVRRTPTPGCSSPAASPFRPSRCVERLGLRGRVELVGRYAQRDAPDLMRRAHLLLHTKVQRPVSEHA